MCHKSCVEFGETHITEKDIKGKTVIEVGSRNINGSFRGIVEKYHPVSYIGVDIEEGVGVDQICAAENLLNFFGYGKFDVVICTELLEHIGNWKRIIHNLKNILKSNGILIITTRSKGFPYHGCPFDWWRYEVSDMEDIFSDFNISVLIKDEEHPGVFLKAMKPANFNEHEIKNRRLFSITLWKRVSFLRASVFYFSFILPLYKISKNKHYFSRFVYYNANFFEIPKLVMRKINKL